MSNLLFTKYEYGLGLIAVCFAILILFEFFARKQKLGIRAIIIHLVLTGILCAIVSLTAEYLQMAIKDFKVKFISAQTIYFVQILLITLIIMRTIFFLLNRLEARQVAKGADRTSARIITRVFKILIFFVILLLFGERFGMSLSGLLTFGGIGGIAIGMASKDILSNFFSGVMLYFDRPFNIGDWVSSPDRQIEGTVVEIGWRITKIMTFDHRPLYIPNAVFSTISVENPGRMTNRRIKTELGLRYQDADKIGIITSEIRTMLQNHPKIDTKQTLLVYFNEFADSSLNIMIYCFTKTVKWAEWLEYQQDVYLKMIEIVHQHGADFAFPSQTVYLDNDEAPVKLDISLVNSDKGADMASQLAAAAGKAESETVVKDRVDQSQSS
ncbi:mechanosensitive ion channel family protein [Ignatzschineria larvae DSM 13226]|uniref:Mechanosensitive ion channel family protein n=1 Tax=Ignatzschineria larvae DSM 13226 TaxID=1111732 RepID=A0ABZ3C0G3_9GAMM|nr:mechanosensitive ion channel family protein [Ignatzschineria larvae]